MGIKRKKLVQNCFLLILTVRRILDQGYQGEKGNGREWSLKGEVGAGRGCSGPVQLCDQVVCLVWQFC